MQHNILYAVVNTEANREFLENAPHRQLHDLSVVYRIRLGNDEYGKEISMKINNDIMNKMELTEQNLFDLASEIRIGYILQSCVHGGADTRDITETGNG